MDSGEQLIVEAGEEDLDSFFKDKDRRKRERLALKKAKAKADREAAANIPVSAWMTPDEAEQQLEADYGAAGAEQPVEDLTSEELAARMQAQAAIHRPEDEEWIDPEREFAPAPGAHKKKHRHHQEVAPEDDKLLQLVAPAAAKLQDWSAIEKDRAAKAKAAATASSAKGWSKVANVEPEPIPAAAEPPAPAKEPEPEPKKAEPEPPAAAPAGEPVPSGVYVPRHKRTEAAAAPSGHSPRTQSPATRPTPSASEAAPAPGSYVPPGLRRQMEEASAARSAPSAGGSSRPAGSGLAASTTTRQAVQAKQKVMPDLKSADEFPTLG